MVKPVRHVLRGIDVVFMVSATESRDRVDHHRTFIDTASAAGVEHIIYLSFQGSSPGATFTLAPRLAIERLRGIRDGGVLDVLAMIAFTVSAFLMFTVACGTWMFVQRWRHPTAAMQKAFDLDAATPGAFLQGYVIMAIVACAFLAAPVLNLGAAAARLGARGRARRLASLRLIGMSGGEVIAMSVVETLVQAAGGTVLGNVLWFANLASHHFPGTTHCSE